MKATSLTHAFVATAQESTSRALVDALRTRGWSADTGSPGDAPAALRSGRYSVAIAEFARACPAPPDAQDPKPPRGARLLALCRPQDAFFVLREAAPCAYALQPLDASTVADAAASLAHGRSPAVPLEVEPGIVLDTQARRVFGPGGMWQLRRREFELLRLLVSRRGQVVSRDETIRHLYRWGEDIGSNAVDVHIHALRRQLAHLPIRTVRGEGYVLCDGPQ